MKLSTQQGVSGPYHSAEGPGPVYQSSATVDKLLNLSVTQLSHL